MIEIRRLDTCSFQTVVEIWNRGFHGYAVDLTQTLDSLLARIISHGISISDSLVALVDGEAVGFLLNGLRVSGESRLAWNGGTAVVPEMRGKGVGKKLVEAALDLYVNESVNRAMLEAISNNESAIKLYSGCGYEVVDELTFLQHDEVVHEWQTTSSAQSYTAVSAPPVVTAKLSFYYPLSPWQAHWESVALACGEGMLVRDTTGEAVGYALLKKKFTREGKIESISLFQCEVAPGRRDESQIARFILQKAFAAELGKLKRTTYNLRKSNRVVVDALHRAGFTTFIEQVHMTRTF
jgi:ribosomal protein S18 acetylase RimI-like enzyme